MPRYRSIAGKWYPVKEKFINVNAENDDAVVYTGPDRAASEILEKEGREFLGEDCRMQEELHIKAGKMGCKSGEEYLKKFKGIDLEKVEKEQNEKLEKEIFHANQEKIVRKQAIDPPSGGQDTSGQGNSKKGGFGAPNETFKEGGLKSRA